MSSLHFKIPSSLFALCFRGVFSFLFFAGVMRCSVSVQQLKEEGVLFVAASVKLNRLTVRASGDAFKIKSVLSGGNSGGSTNTVYFRGKG